MVIAYERLGRREVALEEMAKADALLNERLSNGEISRWIYTASALLMKVEAERLVRGRAFKPEDLVQETAVYRESYQHILAHLNQGNMLARKRQYAAALQSYEKAIALPGFNWANGFVARRISAVYWALGLEDEINDRLRAKYAPVSPTNALQFAMLLTGVPWELPEDLQRIRTNSQDRMDLEKGWRSAPDSRRFAPLGPNLYREEHYKDAIAVMRNSLDVVEQAAVDELAGDNGFVAVFLREQVAVLLRERELMLAESLQFSEVVVARVWTRELQAGIGFDCEVEFRGEFEVDECPGPKIAEEEVEFPNGIVCIIADLQIPGEKDVAGG